MNHSATIFRTYVEVLRVLPCESHFLPAHTRCFAVEHKSLRNHKVREIITYLVRVLTCTYLHHSPPTRTREEGEGRAGGEAREEEAEEAPGNCLRGRQHGEMLWNMKSEEQPRECDRHESAVSQ